MKVLLLLFLLSSSAAVAVADDAKLYVGVRVDADVDVQLAVKSCFTRELRKIPDVVVQDIEQSGPDNSKAELHCTVLKLDNQENPITLIR